MNNEDKALRNTIIAISVLGLFITALIATGTIDAANLVLG